MGSFEIEKSVKMLLMKFPSRMEYIEAAIKNTSEFIRLHNKAIDVFGLKLVLSESITNAVVHGNKENEDRDVQVHLTLTPEDITIKIKDRGEGFSWKKHIAPEMDDTSLTSGRGFSLITAYGYDVSFNKRGNAVCLIKKLDDLSDEKAP
jgi:anti-sigma regulatory factor (Ser/Thr protein kinase)